MPETPEMELYKINLNRFVKGKLISNVKIYRKKSLNISDSEFVREIIYTHIESVDRKGKYLIFNLSNGLFLLTHMMLDGRLFYLPLEMQGDTDIDFDHADLIKRKVHGIPGKPSVAFILDDKSVLFFCRLTLGFLHLLKSEQLQDRLSEIGIDVLDPMFNEEYLESLLDNSRGMIKPWLMNQKYLAGIGNAYSNESLFYDGILPHREIKSLTHEEKWKLYKSLISVIKESIEKGGDMEEPFMPSDNFTGGFIPYFKVYDREGEPCKVCGNVIESIEIGGRKAFFCSNCQR